MLQDKESGIQRLVDSNILGVFSWDIHGSIIDANEAFSRIIGYPQDELLSGKVRWTDITPPEWHGVDKETIAALFGSGIVMPYEKEFIHKNGARVRVLSGR